MARSAAVLEDRQVDHGHVDSLGKFGQSHSALLEQQVEVHGDLVIAGLWGQGWRSAGTKRGVTDSAPAR